MPAGAARDDANIFEFAKLLLGESHFAKIDFSAVLRNASDKSVAYGARLLKNLLLHVVLVATFFRHDGIPGDVMRLALDGFSVVVHDAHAVFAKHGDIAIDQEKHVACVFQQRGNIAGDKIFAFAKTNDGGWAEARGKIFFDQVRHDFRISFRDEFVPFALQLLFELQIIFDDAVVDHHDLSRAITVRVRVFFGRAPMRGPAGVPNSISSVDWRFLDDLFQVAQLAGRAANFQFARSVDHRDTRGVIAAVFQFAQPFDNDRNNLFVPDIADNSAHAAALLGSLSRSVARRSKRL